MDQDVIAKYLRVIAVFLGFFAVVLFVYILIVMKVILVPILIAMFLTIILSPVLEWMTRIKIPHKIGILILLVMVFGAVYFTAFLLANSLVQLISGLPDYGVRFVQLAEEVLKPFNITVQEVAASLNIKLRTIQTGQIIIDWFNVNLLPSTIQFVTVVLRDILLVALFWAFMVAGKRKFDERFNLAFTVDRQSFMGDSLRSIIRETQNYLIIKSLINFICAIILTIYFLAFGAEYALLWGILTFLLHYIPNIGSIINAIVPIFFYFVTNGITVTSIIYAAGLSGLLFYLGNVFEPKFLGKYMNLSPVVVLIALVFWGWVWGVVGMFLAVPIASSIRIIASNVEVLKPLAVLMSRGTGADPGATVAMPSFNSLVGTFSERRGRRKKKTASPPRATESTERT